MEKEVYVMKKYAAAILSLSVFSLVITIILLFFMPSQIPAHYDAAGTITRLGSKYESLIWPGAVALFVFFSLLVDKLSAALGKTERLVIRTFMVGVILFFIGMSVFYMVKSIQYGRLSL